MKKGYIILAVIAAIFIFLIISKPSEQACKEAVMNEAQAYEFTTTFAGLEKIAEESISKRIAANEMTPEDSVKEMRGRYDDFNYGATLNKNTNWQ